MTILPSDVDLINSADLILSLVPPCEALATARRIACAYTYANRGSRPPPCYVDLNATSRATAEAVAALFRDPLSLGRPEAMRFLDGAIFAGPRIAVSGPPVSLDPQVEKALGIRKVGDRVGQASTLKMCVATVTHGLRALALCSFTTAARNGMADELQRELAEVGDVLAFAQSGLKELPAKAWRRGDEMENIKEAHVETGFGANVFQGCRDIFRFVAEETESGRNRVEGGDVAQVVEEVGESMKTPRKRAAEEEENGGGKRPRVDDEDEDNERFLENSELFVPHLF
jgi:3-hydroxyisobutyrate dehydrogenase-like beta-hydroxyacid dehydrogenase